MFKREVKKYSNFLNYINTLEVLYQLEQFLENLDDVKNVKITKDETKWSIETEDLPEAEFIVYDSEIIDEDEVTSVSGENEHFLDEPVESQFNELSSNEEMQKIWKCQFCTENYDSEKDLDCHLAAFHRDVLNIKSHDDQKITQSKTLKDTFDKSSNLKRHAVTESPKMYHSDYYIDSSSTKRRRLNTLNDLQQDQIDWIREKVSNSEVKKGRRKSYKCTECDVILSTQASLVRHLRDLHVLKNPQDEKTILKEQVVKCQTIIDTENGQETVWKCSICEPERIYKSEQSFKLHFRMNHIRDTKIDRKVISSCKITLDNVKNAWKCPECSKIFMTGDSLKNHLKSFHADDVNESIALKDIENDSKTDNSCDECGVKFIAAKHHVKLKVHRECHDIFNLLAPIVPHHKCDKCRTVFNSEESLYKHLLVHDRADSLTLIQVDGLTSFGANYFKDPTGDADDAVDEAVWKCGHCTVRYFEENDCVSHQLLLHSSTLYCCIDNREFSGTTGLSKFIQHTKNKHPELFPSITYSCTTCKLEFPSIYKKLSHQKVCELKKYECDYCSKRYASKHQLQAHMLFEIGISGYTCTRCGKRCKTMSDLRIHNNIHTGLRPYKCSLCEKTFKTPAARSSHMEKHGEGIACEICGAKLTSRTLYQRHKKFQHNQEFRESQFEKNSCSICDKSFLRTAHFRQHMKQHQRKGCEL